MRTNRYDVGGGSIANNILATTVVVATAGNTNLIAAPGVGKRLLVQFLKGQRTSGNIGNTVALIKMAETQIDYCAFGSDCIGYVFVDAMSEMQLWRLPINAALQANHDTANSITYTIRYLTVDG